MNDFLRIDKALARARDLLEPASESPRLDAELLLARALDVTRSFLIAHADEEFDGEAAERFEAAINKRVSGMPLAYITGEKEFWSMNLVVTPATLVPRPDTEILVDHALRLIPQKSIRHVIDLGTGSGAVALAIASERPQCEVVAIDICAKALAVANENASRQQLPNIEFVCGNWLEPVRDRRFDVIVSNPPYVAVGDPHLDGLRFEPRLALAAGRDGLDAFRVVAGQAPGLLNPSGKMLLEHGESQQEAVAEILSAHGWRDIECAKDLGGRPRITIARI
ncbi:MAG: peptide chain release factor N(5)-glutamine methyltransferase [Woeseiaceae bacterium]